jgi:acetyl-CoA carboxylase biotin carboxyl carrier protein
MSDNKNGFDPAVADLVRALAALLDEAHLSEIEYAEGDRRLRVSRAAVGAAVTLAPAASVLSGPAGGASPCAAAPEAIGTVKAPMVGTVYLSPQPDSAPFIKIGDQVREGQTLLIVEAMKVMNHIAAPRAGRVSAILVGDGAPVEYGQPLLVLE